MKLGGGTGDTLDLDALAYEYREKQGVRHAEKSRLVGLDRALDDIAARGPIGPATPVDTSVAGNYRASNAEIQRLHKEVDRHFGEAMRLSHDLGHALGRIDNFKRMAERATKGSDLERQLAASLLVSALLMEKP